MDFNVLTSIGFLILNPKSNRWKSRMALEVPMTIKLQTFF